MPGMAGGEKANAAAPGILLKAAIHVLQDGLVLLVRGFAMSPFLERDEKHAAVARVHAGENVVAGDRADVLDSGRGLEDFLSLPHDLVGALEGEASGRMTCAKK